MAASHPISVADRDERRDGSNRPFADVVHRDYRSMMMTSSNIAYVDSLIAAGAVPKEK